MPTLQTNQDRSEDALNIVASKELILAVNTEGVSALSTEQYPIKRNEAVPNDRLDELNTYVLRRGHKLRRTQALNNGGKYLPRK